MSHDRKKLCSNDSLDSALTDLIERATALDNEGAPWPELGRPKLPCGNSQLPDDLAAGRAEETRELQGFYRTYQESIDAALLGAQQYLASDEGTLDAERLAAHEMRFDANGEPELLTGEAYEAAVRIGQAALREANQLGTALLGVGVGVSAGATFFVGGFVGAEVLVTSDRDEEFAGRAWFAVAAKTGILVDLGIELSFWIEEPVKCRIAGGIYDVALSTTKDPVITSGIWRVMTIRQLTDGLLHSLSGISVTLPWPVSAGLPLRRNKTNEKCPFAIGGYIGCQYTPAKSKRYVFTVENTSLNDGDSVVTGTEATLQITFTNKTSSTFLVSNASTLVFLPPSYYASSEVEAMAESMSATNWSAAYDDTNNTIKLTPNGQITVDSGDSMVFTCNATTSSVPPADASIQPGTFNFDLQDPSLNPNTLVKSATLNLLADYSTASLSWTLTYQPSRLELDKNESAKGSCPAYSTATSQFKKLTSATDLTTNKDWNIGYVFDLNEMDSNEPRVSAVWWEEGTPPIVNRTYFISSPVTPDTKNKEAIEKLTGDNAYNYITIKVTFD